MAKVHTSHGINLVRESACFLSSGQNVRASHASHVALSAGLPVQAAKSVRRARNRSEARIVAEGIRYSVEIDLRIPQTDTKVQWTLSHGMAYLV